MPEVKHYHKFHYVYEIYVDDPTDELNGKYYYGKHHSDKLPDSYFGSGKLIREYIAKKGVSCLKKNNFVFLRYC